MDATVVPVLREALRALNEERPADPLQVRVRVCVIVCVCVCVCVCNVCACVKEHKENKAQRQCMRCMCVCMCVFEDRREETRVRLCVPYVCVNGLTRGLGSARERGALAVIEATAAQSLRLPTYILVQLMPV